MALGRDGRLGGTRIVPTIRTRIVLSGLVSYYPDPYRTIRPSIVPTIRTRIVPTIRTRIVLSGRESYYPAEYRTIRTRIVLSSIVPCPLVYCVSTAAIPYVIHPRLLIGGFLRTRPLPGNGLSRLEWARRGAGAGRV